MQRQGLSEQEFRIKSDQALESARRSLLPLADTDGFEIELHRGVLNVVFEDPVDARFVVSPRSAARSYNASIFFFGPTPPGSASLSPAESPGPGVLDQPRRWT